MKALRLVVGGLPMVVGLGIGFASTYSLWYALLTIPCSFVIGMAEGILEAISPDSLDSN